MNTDAELDRELLAGYLEMAQDLCRERNADDWCEGLVADALLDD